jgi:ribonuclease D
VQLPIPATCWKVAGSTEISSGEAAILQALCDFREDQASRRNLPPFKILPNDVLLNLSKEQPLELAALSEIRGLSPLLIQRYGSEIINKIKLGQASEPLFRPNKVRPDDKFLRRLDALKEWRKLKGKELKVESDVILPREILENISAANPASSQQLHSIMAQIPWRFQHFSKEIFTVLRKQEVS